MVDMVDMVPTEGANPLPGIGQYIYLAVASEILSLKKPVAVPTTNAQIVTITEDHVMKEGKKAIRLYSVRNKGSYETKSSGGPKMKGSESTVKAFLPGDDATARGMIHNIQNRDLVLWVPNRSGFVTQYGDEILWAQVDSYTIKSGEKTGDDVGVEIVFGTDGLIPRVYTGAIPLTPGAPEV